MIRELNRDEVVALYKTNLKEDFTPEELKPIMAMEYLMEEGNYFAYGMYEEEKLMAYAFFASAPEREYVLLDYYAVTADSRGRGIGTKFMREWQEALRECGCKAVLAEVEAPDVIEDERERHNSQRRMEFYHRNGLRDTAIRTWLFRVKYRILSLDLASPESKEVLYRELIRIYRRIFPDFYFGKQVVMSDDAHCNMIQPGIFSTQDAE